MDPNFRHTFPGVPDPHIGRHSQLLQASINNHQETNPAMDPRRFFEYQNRMNYPPLNVDMNQQNIYPTDVPIGVPYGAPYQPFNQVPNMYPNWQGANYFNGASIGRPNNGVIPNPSAVVQQQQYAQYGQPALDPNPYLDHYRRMMIPKSLPTAQFPQSAITMPNSEQEINPVFPSRIFFFDHQNRMIPDPVVMEQYHQLPKNAPNSALLHSRDTYHQNRMTQPLNVERNMMANYSADPSIVMPYTRRG